MTQIIVALIGAFGSIIAALIARKREETPPSPDQKTSSGSDAAFRSSPTPRPKLVFACILGLGIAITGVVVALLPRHIDTVLEERSPNVSYQERESGFVFALAEADRDHRSVAVDGFINNERVVSAGAQDATDPRVPSIGASSFVMPVQKGQTWQIKTQASKPNVKVKWYALRTDAN